MGQYDRKAQSQRKHGPLTISGGPKAPAPPPSQRPEWRGSGYVKKKPPKPSQAPSTPQPTPQTQFLPVELQQSLLNVFRDLFLVERDFEEWKGVLSRVNEGLSRGDLGVLKGEEEKKGFALRWSPSRGLAYGNVLAWLCEVRREDGWCKRLLNASSIEEEKEIRGVMKMVCFGGGAAEVVGLGGLLRHLHPLVTAGKSQQEIDSVGTLGSTTETSPPILDLHLVDPVDWTSITNLLHTAMTAPPPLSKYASAAARASNTSLLSSSAINISLITANILDLGTKDLQTIIGEQPTIVTFFMTLNDLYTTSIPKTTAFLKKLEAVLPQESLLLIIDNIGASISSTISSTTPSSSTTSSTAEAAPTPIYPMDWLLTRILLGPPKRPGESDDEDEENKPPPKWEKIVEEKLKIHKLDEKLRYPGSLENLRFQVLGFKRV